MHQADTSMVPAGRSTRDHAALAREHGAALYDEAPVTGLVDGATTVSRSWSAMSQAAEPRRRTAGSGASVVLTADAWTNDLLAHLGTADAADRDRGSR